MNNIKLSHADLGMPKPKRQQEFAKLSKNSQHHHQLMFKGQLTNFPIIRIPINLALYRLNNGRTASAQEEYLAKNPSIPADFFTADPELLTVQATQHEILTEMSGQQDLRKFFENTSNKQEQVIILDHNGFVVNGNRRLATWRNLYKSDLTKYSHFAYINAIVLDQCDEKEIDRIEARLQISKDIKANYSWDARATMMRRKMQRDGFSIKELADLYEMSDSEIKSMLSMLDYGSEYLKSRGQDGLWSNIKDKEYAFKNLEKSASKISAVNKKALFISSAFALIDSPDDAGGRLYEKIPSVAEFLPQITEKLAEKFPPSIVKNEASVLDDFIDTAIGPADDSIDAQIANKVAESPDEARDIIVEVIESQKALKKEVKGNGFLLSQCAKAQAALKTAIDEFKVDSTSTQGVEGQLLAIEERIAEIRFLITKNAST